MEPNVIKVPEDYRQIQQAIEAANSGDIIQVASGIYSENLRIEKPLRLIGEGPDKTIVAKSGTVVSVNADNVEIRGFSVQDGTYGIFLWFSRDVLLRNNDLSDNKWNFGVWGNSLSHFIHDIDSSNTVNGKPICFWINQHGKPVPHDAGYVALVNSTNITAKNLELTSNEQGVLLVHTNNSVIQDVTMSGNDEGIDLRMSHNNTIGKNQLLSINWRAIYLWDSGNNTFYENTILNSTYGLSIQDSSENVFYHNNFIDNKDQVYIEASQTFWYSEEIQEGNFWSDYTGVDADDDGVGDIPYSINPMNKDRYPLMKPWDIIPPVANAGRNQTVSVNQNVTFDASGSSDNWGITSYEWDFGDGTIGIGITASHIYANLGVYTATLTVKDAAGNSATDTLSIAVVELSLPFSWWILVVGFGVGAIIILVVAFRRCKPSRK